MKNIKKTVTLILCAAVLAAAGIAAGVAASESIELDADMPELLESTAPSDWAAVYVETSIELGIVPLYLRTQYTQAATRAEFCAIAVTVYESVAGEITGRKEFEDTDDENAQKAAFIGVMTGIDVSIFDPDSLLTREEAAVILSQLADALEMPLPREATTFADIDNISEWALEQVGCVQAAGIMSGIGDNMFAPQGLYTREQCIITIVRLYDMIMADSENGTAAEDPPEGDLPLVDDGSLPVWYIRVGYDGSADYPDIIAITSRSELEEYFGIIPDDGEDDDENQDENDDENQDEDQDQDDDDDDQGENEDSSISERLIIDSNGELLDVLSRYTDGFFENHYLVLIFKQEGSGSNRHRLDAISDDGTVIVARLLPEMGTADMAQWHIIIEFESDFQPEQFEVVFINEAM